MLGFALARCVHWLSTSAEPKTPAKPAPPTAAEGGHSAGIFRRLVPIAVAPKKGKSDSMQRNLLMKRRSDEEAVKEAGLTLDFDEIARKGSMSREEASIAKWYGIYHSRQPGHHMARVVIPGGKMTSVEARTLAKLSATYSPQRISFTTRQSAQLHCLKLKDLPQLLRDLAAAGMTTFHGCGDVTRNVAACPWASICPHRRLDVLPLAQQTARELSACRELDNLPRKFKITFSGCAAECGQPAINCVGVVALRRRRSDGSEEDGFPRRPRRRHGLAGVCRPAALRLRPAGADRRRLPRRRPFLPRPRRPPHSHVRRG